MLLTDSGIFSARGIKCRKLATGKAAEAGYEIRGLILPDIIVHKENLTLSTMVLRRRIADVDQGGWWWLRSRRKTF